jgi:hypothetical protein
VRRALFDTTATTFGFIVPTPTVPQLGEVAATVFDTLAKVTAPEIVERSERTFEPSCVCGLFLRGSTKAAAPFEAAVRVIATQTVAGYSAVVLEADEAGALSKWLADHGYDDPPTLREWVAPYIAAKWKLTAFRLTTADSVESVRTSVVRMSFATAQPFFPYREPSDQRAARALPPGATPDKRLLRVYAFASARMTGTIGTNGTWLGLTSYAKPADPSVLGVVSQAVPEYVPQAHGWLTRFDDESSPRPGTDEVYFAVAPSLGELTPPQQIVVHDVRVHVPVDLIAFALFACGTLFLVVRRGRRKAA